MADERFGGMLGMMQGLEEPGQTDNDYFEVVRRPLDIPFGTYFYNWTVHPKTVWQNWLAQRFPDAAHWHLLSPSGENVGLGGNGRFSERLRNYEGVPAYQGQKIPGAKVREFIRRKQEPWDKAKEFFEQHPEVDLGGFNNFQDQYSLFKYNCKDFIKDIEPPSHPQHKKPSLFGEPFEHESK